MKTKATATLFALAMLVSATSQADDVLGQIKSGLDTFSRYSKNMVDTTSYIDPGTNVRLADGRTAQVYGFDCRKGEQSPCSSIKITNDDRRVLIVPQSGQPIKERWTIKKAGSRLIIIRPNGEMVQALN